MQIIFLGGEISKTAFCKTSLIVSFTTVSLGIAPGLSFGIFKHI